MTHRKDTAIPDILHRISIDAPPEAVHDLVATTGGGCSTNWGAYLTSLKTGAEGVGFRPYPQGRDQPLGMSTAAGSRKDD